ncbi:Permease of the drug/metabolite transporter (DMT) superfamily [Palleronia salina]|uniref:Permease of the drug/metabolite transporter (DMT) superfamily n=1 Tax=Palleronia salina TaxID=313368 RepID=A0A1M6DML2_9RHOB|nr:Permease of the drug/metabolite transporter (DMT) superfamily [Palleronia salina]
MPSVHQPPLHHEVAAREDRLGLGVGMMALAVLGFTCIDTSAKWLVLAGLPAIQVVFARYAVHFLQALVMFLPREGGDAIRSNAPKRQALRSLFLMGSTVCNFTALQYLPLTVTTTIMFSGPIAVTLLAIPILGERVGIHRLVAVCVGFLGVLVVMQPWGAEFHPAMLLNLLAMTLASLYFIMTRMLAGIESNATSQVWASGLATLVLLPFAWSVWVWPDSVGGYVVLCLVGIFGGTSHIFATYAHRLADASILAPMIYIQIVLAAIASILVFGTWPTVWTLLGGLIIIAAGVYIWHRERERRGPPPPSPATR